MSHDYKKTWETYTSSWKAESSDDKRAIYETCLGDECIYNDPLVKTTG